MEECLRTRDNCGKRMFLLFQNAEDAQGTPQAAEVTHARISTRLRMQGTHAGVLGALAAAAIPVAAASSVVLWLIWVAGAGQGAEAALQLPVDSCAGHLSGPHRLRPRGTRRHQQPGPGGSCGAAA